VSQARQNNLRNLSLVLLFLVLGGAAIWFFINRGQETPKEPEPEPPVADIPARSLEQLIRDTRNELNSPGETVAQAADYLETKEAIVAFVRERVAYSSYQGHLQPPDIVLKTRTANSVDNAILLQAMLKEIEIDTQLKKALTWPDAVPAYGQPGFSPPPSLYPLMKEIGYEPNNWRAELQAQIREAAESVSAIRTEVDSSMAKINFVLNEDAAPSHSEHDPRTERDWVWLETPDGTVFDPVFPDVARPANSASYVINPVDTDISLKLRDGNGRRQNILQWSGNAFGRDIRLGFLPALDTINRLEGSPDPSDIRSWIPVLSNGGAPMRGEVFTIDGASLQKLDDALPFTVTDGNLVVPDPVPVTQIDIGRVDIADWPRVNMTVTLKTDGPPKFVAPHFILSENDQRRPVRIDSLYNDPAPVIVIADTSGSMAKDGKFQMIRQIGSGMINGLNDAQPLAIVTFGDQDMGHPYWRNDGLSDRDRAGSEYCRC